MGHLTSLLRSLLVLFIIASSLSLQAEEAFRTFTNGEGQTIQAKILSATDDEIRIEMENGQRMWVNNDLFSKKDQEFIAQWRKDDALSQPRSFDFEVNKDRDRGTDSKSESTKTDRDKVGFTFEIKNKSGFDLESVKIEYEIYYYEGSNSKEVDKTLKVEKGDETIEGFMDGMIKVAFSKKVTLVEEDLRSGWSYVSGYQAREDEMLGCVARLYYQGKLLREESSPNTLLTRLQAMRKRGEL